jgi:ribosomal protein L7/L12
MSFASDGDIEQRIAWLEQAVQRLAATSSPSITLPPRPGTDVAIVSDEVRALVDQGNKLEAIKLHRIETGAGLAEAKAAVDSI